MDKIKWVVILTVLITTYSCKKFSGTSTEKNLHSSEGVTQSIDFSDQVSFNPKDKWFTKKMTYAAERYLAFDLPVFFRLDVDGIGFRRFWFRYYNGFFELRFSDNVISTDFIEYNYLFGMKNKINEGYRAFYIKWRNTDSMTVLHGSSDIGKQTKYIESSLPDSVITYYFKDISCPIVHNNSIGDSIEINWGQIGRFTESRKILLDEKFRKLEHRFKEQ